MLLRHLWPVLAWSALILVLSGIPGDYIPEVGTFWDWLGPDKLAHLILFGVFSVLFLTGAERQYQCPWLRSYSIPLVVIVGMIFGSTTEIMQRFALERTVDAYESLFASLAVRASEVVRT